MTQVQGPTPAPPIDVQRCRSCDAPIIWAVTQRGSRIPLDAKHQLGFVVEGERVHGAPRVSQKRVYTTHFATCPKADQHRKRGQR